MATKAIAHINKKHGFQPIVLICVLVAILLTVRDLVGVSINSFIFVGIAAFAFLYFSYADIVYLLCFFFPLSCGLPGTYIYAIAMIALLCKSCRLSIGQFLVPLIFIAQEFALSAFYPEFSFSTMISYASRLFMLFFLIFDKSERVDYGKAILFFSVSVLFMSIVVAAISLKDRSVIDYMQGRFRIGRTKDIVDVNTDTMMISNNANNIAYYVLAAIACNLLLIKTGRYNTPFHIFSTIVLAFIGTLTISRMYLLVLIFIFFYYLFFNLRLNRKNRKALMLALVFVVTGVVYALNHPELIRSYISRFNESTDSIDDTRLAILREYIDYLFNNIIRLFIGLGVLQVSSITGFSTAIHNGTAQILVSYGIFGFIFFLGSLIRAVQFAAQRCGRVAENWMPLIAVVIFVQSIQFLSPFELMMPFVIGVYALMIRKDQGVCDGID